MKIIRIALNMLICLFFLSACQKDALEVSTTESTASQNTEVNVVSAFGIALEGSQEVPANSSKATGTMNISYNKTSKILKYRVTWENLTGNAVAAHIHGEAPAGTNAPVKHPIEIPASTSGTITDSVLVDEDAIKEADLLNGLYYINIHTPMFPGGEIRGQIVFEKDEDQTISKKGLVLCADYEVPKNNSPATGKFDISYNRKSKVLRYTIRWSGLTGNPIAAHIHGEAPRGINAPVKHPISIPATTSGTITDSVVVDEIAIKEFDLLNGLYYINIHTPLNPGGEIRGQIEFESTLKATVIKSGLTITGGQEVPANNSPAKGTLNVSYNKMTKLLYYQFSWEGLTGNATAAHIHGEATKGVNAPVKHPIPISSTTSGSFTGSVLVDEIAIKEADLLKGLYYLNIHTPLNPGGEIRSQIVFK